MSEYRQDPPFCIQVELATGCNLQCSFCGINGFQTKPNSNFSFMTVKTADNVASQIAEAGWNSRVEFAMHGEPLANPEWEAIVEIFRHHLPKAHILLTTNGGFLLKGDPTKNINKYFNAGGTVMAIDMYEDVNFGRKLLERVDTLDLVCDEVYSYPEDKEGNPHHRSTKTFLSFIQDISVASKGTHANLQNHAGSAGELDFSRTDKPCVKPFREMGVNADGSVDICCNDWLGEMTCGNVNQTTIEDIWHSDPFYAVRKMLMARKRTHRPCLGCSDMGYRVGLLPDKKGKVTLPLPDDWDVIAMEEALAVGPSRKPIGETKKRLTQAFPEINFNKGS